MKVKDKKFFSLALTLALAVSAAGTALAAEGPGTANTYTYNYNIYGYSYGNGGPAYGNGSSSGPGATGTNPGNTSSIYDNIISLGPGSQEANDLLALEEDDLYIFDTVYEGTWEELEGGKWRLLDSNGNFVSSKWAYLDGKRYLLDMYGVMITGFQMVNGETYYFNSVGAMQTGWLLKEGKYYFLNSDGTMVHGWVNTRWDGEDNWYYFDPYTGVMWTNSYTPDGWYVNAEGVCIYPNYYGY